MTVNEADNRALALIAYGSYAPGGENHARLSFFSGEWRKGFVLGTRHTSDDDIGPGEDLIDAWVLELPHPQEDLSSRQNKAWLFRLHDLWMALDAVMGEGMVRDSWQWCPKDSSATDDAAGTVMANIYLPRERFQKLAYRSEQLHPWYEDNLEQLWRQVYKSEKKYDASHFSALIRDSNPERFDYLFERIKDGGQFLERLRRLFDDHQRDGSGILPPGSDRLYPLVRNARPAAVLLELARRDIAQRAAFFRASGWEDEAEMLENLTFVNGKPERPTEETVQLAESFDSALWTEHWRSHWEYCLAEACNGIAADQTLQHWLMLFLLQPDLPQPKPRPRGGLISRLGLRRESPSLDLEPAYSLWKAGGRYEIDGKRCCVYEAERREG